MRKSIGIKIIGWTQIIGVIALWVWFLKIIPNFSETLWIYYFIFYSLLMLSAGIGILLLKNWARLLTILLVFLKAFEIIFKLGKKSYLYKSLNIAEFTVRVSVLAICIFIIWFLSREFIKKQFIKKGSGSV